IHGKGIEVMFSREWIDRFVERSLPYWLSQGMSSPHEKPIYYFANILLRYEFLPIAIAIASIPTKRSFEFKEMFAIVWVVIAFVFYHAMVYKTSWLVVHLATPIAFFGMVFMRKDFFEKKETKIAFAIGFIATLLISIHITYFDYNNVSQPLIYVQTQNDAVKMAERIKELVNKNYSVAVFAVDGHYWPLPWMLREEKVVFTTLCPQGYDYVFAVYRDYNCLSGYEIVGKYELRKFWEFYELRKL
ncbi:MAG: hypothetical protein QXW59_01050, partial [Archaeoglobaceae archaeon]